MATTRRIVPSEAMRRELRGGGRAFLQYLCDAGLTGDEASRLADHLHRIRDRVCDWHCDGTPGCAPDDCGAYPDSERDCDGCPGVVTRAEHMALANELRETRQAVSELLTRFNNHHHKTPHKTDGPST